MISGIDIDAFMEEVQHDQRIVFESFMTLQVAYADFTNANALAFAHMNGRASSLFISKMDDMLGRSMAMARVPDKVRREITTMLERHHRTLLPQPFVSEKPAALSDLRKAS